MNVQNHNRTDMNQGVRKNSEAVGCDSCGNWCHIKCGIKMSEEDYHKLVDVIDSELFFVMTSCKTTNNKI